MIRHTICVIALACLTATGAQAVHLSDVEGSVLVNNKKIAASKDVVAGDRVKVVSGAVKIVYDNGAVVNVAAGQTMVVLQTPPDLPVQASSSKDADVGIGFGLGDTGLLLGGALIAGGGAAAAAVTSNSHSGGSGAPSINGGGGAPSTLPTSP